MIPIRFKGRPVRGRAVRRTAGKMNGWEMRYSQVLERRLKEGKIQHWSFDRLKLRLADKTFYETDFLVIAENGEIEVHEVKGHWEDDARVKIKVAAEMFPFRFLAVTIDKRSGEWKKEEF